MYDTHHAKEDPTEECLRLEAYLRLAGHYPMERDPKRRAQLIDTIRGMCPPGPYSGPLGTTEVRGLVFVTDSDDPADISVIHVPLGTDEPAEMPVITLLEFYEREQPHT